MELQQGQKLKLDESLIKNQFTVNINANSSFHIDISCFGLDANDKLSDEDYMIFYNQKSSPNNSIEMSADVPNSKFNINLNNIPSHISKLVFTAAIDPSHSQTMSQLDKLQFNIGDNDFTLTGSNFQKEKAVIVSEIYKKDNVWRLNCVGQGFNGGLDALLVHFGGEVASTETTPAEQPKEAPKAKISLEKIFEEKAPQLVSLAKKATVSLEKHNLNNVKAKAAFVLDASGSMTGQYTKKQVQEVVNRVFPLGVHFDNDKELETWAFAQRSKKLSNVTFANYQNYVETEDSGWKNWMKNLDARYNNEPEVIKDIIKHFTGLTPPTNTSAPKGWFNSKDSSSSEEFAPAISSKEPIFILFISDGGVDKNQEIKDLIKWSSSLPIFWQFIGIGGHNYGALEELDDLKGRFLDNADFFAIDDLQQISESELYDRMLTEFPGWLKAAHSKGIIENYMDTHIQDTKTKLKM